MNIKTANVKNKIIGICEGSKYANYERWLGGPGIEIIKLGYKYNNLYEVERCGAILLTSGDDIDPELYSHRPFFDKVDMENVNKERDAFEWKIMEKVEQKQKPLLAICRGLQFVNVFFGGTLVPDMPPARKLKHSKFKDGRDREHTVTLDTSSAVYKIVREKKGVINSGHHQCAALPGAGLKVTAMSPDGTIEAMEKKDNNGKPFFLLIQWHPERMKDTNSYFSKNIKQSFLKAIAEQTDSE